MNDCIYLSGVKEGLTYKKREHVISAGIGGKNKLPKGYVSDQANELFSKYEFNCLRYSPLFIERTKYGPGKRGSLDLDSIVLPDVFSLEPINSFFCPKYVCPLGFVFRNEVYIIPQVVILFKEENDFDCINLRSTFQSNGNIKPSEFQNQFNDFLNSDSHVYKKIDMLYKTKQKFACIGCYGKTWYINSNNANFNIEHWKERILMKEHLINVPNELMGIIGGKSIYRFTRKIELDYIIPAFIHAKNCFNTLAFFKGTEFVLNKNFDLFRQCIINNDNWDKVTVPAKIPKNISKWINDHVNGTEHVVIIYTDINKVMGFSILYGKAWGLFQIGDGYIGERFSYAIICDFENKKEMQYDSGIIS